MSAKKELTSDQHLFYFALASLLKDKQKLKEKVSDSFQQLEEGKIGFNKVEGLTEIPINGELLSNGDEESYYEWIEEEIQKGLEIGDRYFMVGTASKEPLRMAIGTNNKIRTITKKDSKSIDPSINLGSTYDYKSFPYNKEVLQYLLEKDIARIQNIKISGLVEKKSDKATEFGVDFIEKLNETMMNINPSFKKLSFEFDTKTSTRAGTSKDAKKILSQYKEMIISSPTYEAIQSELNKLNGLLLEDEDPSLSDDQKMLINSQVSRLANKIRLAMFNIENSTMSSKEASDNFKSKSIKDGDKVYTETTSNIVANSEQILDALETLLQKDVKLFFTLIEDTDFKNLSFKIPKGNYEKLALHMDNLKKLSEDLELATKDIPDGKYIVKSKTYSTVGPEHNSVGEAVSYLQMLSAMKINEIINNRGKKLLITNDEGIQETVSFDHEQEGKVEVEQKASISQEMS
jgi:hypothetical protein